MHYPLFIDLKDKRVLVLGGGKVGTKRALALSEYGAKVTVVSKTFTKELKDSGLKLLELDVLDGSLPDLADFFMVVAASDDEKANEEIGRLAALQGVLVNRADDHKKGDVIFPLVCDVSGHTLAYTTLGANPKLLKKIKELIADEFAED